MRRARESNKPEGNARHATPITVDEAVRRRIATGDRGRRAACADRAQRPRRGRSRRARGRPRCRLDAARAAINAIEVELDSIPPHPDADTPGGIAEVDPEVAAQLTEVARATDQSLTALGDSVAALGAAEAARKHITQADRRCPAPAGRSIMASLAPGTSTEVDPLVAFDAALRELVSIGQLLPAESGDPQLGRELLAVVKLAEGAYRRRRRRRQRRRSSSRTSPIRRRSPPPRFATPRSSR